MVVEELHLLLRITDRLIDNLVIRAAELDHQNKVHHQTNNAANITKLQETIKSCGIYFKVSESYNIDLAATKIRQ